MERLNVFGVSVGILLERESKADGYTVSILECDPGLGVPRHRHSEREAFYVLQGKLTMEVDGGQRELGPGDFYQVESQVAHRFENPGPEKALIVNLSIPSGHGKFFREADALQRSQQFTPENAVKVCQSNGIEIVEPGD